VLEHLERAFERAGIERVEDVGFEHVRLRNEALHASRPKST